MKKLVSWKTLVILVVIAAVAYYPVKSGVEYYQKDAHYEEVSSFVDSVEPQVVRHMYNLAVKHGCLDAHERWRLSQRLDELDRRGGNYYRGKEFESYSKVGTILRMRIGWHVRKEAKKKTGLSDRFDHDEPAFKKAVAEAFKPFDDVIAMDRILSTLSWNCAGVLWEQSFGSEKCEYTMKRLAEDQEEYRLLRPKLEKLMKKAGI